jgi:hypothetical protein
MFLIKFFFFLNYSILQNDQSETPSNNYLMDCRSS